MFERFYHKLRYVSLNKKRQFVNNVPTKVLNIKQSQNVFNKSNVDIIITTQNQYQNIKNYIKNHGSQPQDLLHVIYLYKINMEVVNHQQHLQ